jgi:hypothetical protein
MIVRFILLVLLSLFLKNTAYSQAWKKSFSVASKGDYLSTDNLGNSFVVNNDQLIKYRDNGTVFRLYSNKKLGRISSIDPMNPLKIVVFYRDFSQVVFLDNTVTENGDPILLTDWELEQASVICSSYDNGLWVFDQVQYSLTRFDQQFKPTVQVKNLNQILEYAPQPVFMMEQNNHLFMSDTAHGILQFDIFGTYIKTIPVKGLEKFQVFGDNLYYANKEGFLVAFGLKTLQENKLKFPVSDYIDMRISQNRLHILGRDSLSVFEFPE